MVGLLMGKGAWESINHVDLKILNSVSNHLCFSNFLKISFSSFVQILSVDKAAGLLCVTEVHF